MSDNKILILLAEDEPLIRAALQDILEFGGYTVLEAQNGTEAISILEVRATEIAGVVTDIRLGAGPDGWVVAHRARELNAQIAVVYVTGDSAGDWPSNGVPKSVILQKPFATAQLVTAVSTLLNEASATSAASTAD